MKLVWCNYDSKSGLQALVSYYLLLFFMFPNLDVVKRHKENYIHFLLITHIGACIFALLFFLLFSFSFLFQKGKKEKTVKIGS